MGRSGDLQSEVLAVRCFLLLICLLSMSGPGFSQAVAQFRGPDRNGVFPETGLLKSWPESGPGLLWSREGLDKGFASPSVTDSAIYLGGRDGDDEYLTVFGEYIIKPQIFEYLEENINNNLREHGEFQLTSALDRLRQEDGFQGLILNGQRFDIGIPEHFLETLARFS